MVREEGAAQLLQTASLSFPCPYTTRLREAHAWDALAGTNDAFLSVRSRGRPIGQRPLINRNNFAGL